MLSNGYDSGFTTYVAIKIRVQNQHRARKKFLEQEKSFRKNKNIFRSRKRFLVIEINKTVLYVKH